MLECRWALVRSGTDVGQLGRAQGVRWGWGQGSVQVLQHRSRQTISVWTSSCSRGLYAETRKGPSPNCCHNIGSTESSRMSVYAVALRFSFTGTKGPSPNHEKQPQTSHRPPPQNFTVGNMHWGRYSSPGIRRNKPRFVHCTARVKHNSSL